MTPPHQYLLTCLSAVKHSEFSPYQRVARACDVWVSVENPSESSVTESVMKDAVKSYRKQRVGRAKIPRWYAGVCLGIMACVYDPNDRCDANQVLAAGTCICDKSAGYTTGSGGCVLCGTHQVPGESGCVCTSGYAQQSNDGPCEPVPETLGTACDTSNSPACADATVNYCFATSGTTGYCTTSGCATNGDCKGGYICNASATPSYCQRPPTGTGEACTTTADCANYEATFCDSTQLKCFTTDCKTSPDDCFPGYACCPLSTFAASMPDAPVMPNVCMPTGSCPLL